MCQRAVWCRRSWSLSFHLGPSSGQNVPVSCRLSVRLSSVFSQHVEVLTSHSFMSCCFTLVQHFGIIIMLRLQSCSVWPDEDLMNLKVVMWHFLLGISCRVCHRSVCLLFMSVCVHVCVCVCVRRLIVVTCLYDAGVYECECVTLCFLRSASPAAQVTLRPRPAMPLALLSPMSFLLLPTPTNPVTVQITWLCVCVCVPRSHRSPRHQPCWLTCSCSSVCMCVDVFVLSHRLFYHRRVFTTCLWWWCGDGAVLRKSICSQSIFLLFWHAENIFADTCNRKVSGQLQFAQVLSQKSHLQIWQSAKLCFTHMQRSACVGSTPNMEDRNNQMMKTFLITKKTFYWTELRVFSDIVQSSLWHLCKYVGRYVKIWKTNKNTTRVLLFLKMWVMLKVFLFMFVHISVQ